MAENREVWNSKKGFVYAAIGAAIGLGNLWRFPFQAYKNGGGAFFLPYIIALFTCGIPLMILEYQLGRQFRGGSTKAFRNLNKKYEWFGWLQVMIPLVVMMFYCTIISVSVIFMVWSLGHMLGIVNLFSSPEHLMTIISGNPQNAFDFKAGISKYMLFFILFVWFGNWIIVKKGIGGGIEKCSKIFTPLLMILMLIFMFNSLRLKGAVLGLNELFTPDFKKILNPHIWISAYAQVFFSTTLAVGVMIAYGSYIPKNWDIVNSSFITVLANASFDIIAGITVFSTLGYLVNSLGVDFNSFGNGAGIAFIAFPIAISKITNNQILQGLIGFIFFLCLFIAGLSSSISMLEAFATSALDKFKIKREKLISIISMVGLIGSACFSTYAGFNYILNIVDSYVGNYIIATLGFIEIILVYKFYDIESIRLGANEFSDFKIGKWFNFLLIFVTPILLGINILSNFINEFKNLTLENIVFGWGTIAIMIIVATIFYKKDWKSDINE